MDRSMDKSMDRSSFRAIAVVSKVHMTYSSAILISLGGMDSIQASVVARLQ